MNSPSPFATVLRELLDDTGVFTREGWGTALGQDLDTISWWLGEGEEGEYEVIPGPADLRSILDILRKHLESNHPSLQKFDELCQLPLDEIFPYQTTAHTLGEYLNQPVLEGFLRVLKTVPPEKQEKILLEAASECRRVRGDTNV